MIDVDDEDDLPERVDVAKLMSALVDTTLALNGYSIRANNVHVNATTGPGIEVTCGRCPLILAIMDGSTVLELVSFVLDHNEFAHNGEPMTSITEAKTP